MLKDLIKFMRANSLRPKEEISIDSLFKTIQKNLKQNQDIIEKTLKNNKKIDILALQKIFVKSPVNNYGNLSSPFINEFGRVCENMTPYGVVGVLVNKNISINNYLEIIKVCLETRNSIIIRPFEENETLFIITTIINEVLKQTVDFNEIFFTNEPIENEDIDLLIYVGEKKAFKNLKVKADKIFLGIGQYELYIDEVVDEKLINFAKNNGIKLYYKHEGVLDEINEEGGNYCTAIMSGNKENIREFISRIKSSYVLVNMSPTLIENANLFPEQLLKRKNTIIFE